MPIVTGNPQARDSVSWKTWSKVWGKHNDEWKRPIAVHVKTGDVWVKVYDERPIVTNVYRYFVYDGYQYINYTTFTLQSNGFVTSLSTNGNFISTNSVAVDTTTNIFAGKYSFPGDFPVVICSNSSGSVTV